MKRGFSIITKDSLLLERYRLTLHYSRFGYFVIFVDDMLETDELNLPVTKRQIDQLEGEIFIRWMRIFNKL